jgi:hypothetical protein
VNNEVDPQVDFCGLLADDVDGGEVKEDVDGHREDRVLAGRAEGGREHAFAQLACGGKESPPAAEG